MSASIKSTAILAAACALVAALGAFLVESRRPAVYESRAEISDPLALRRGAALRGDVFSLGVVIAWTAKRLQPPLAPAEVRRSVSVSTPKRDGRRTISAIAAEPTAARALASEFVAQYIAHRAGALSAQIRVLREALRARLRRFDRREPRLRVLKNLSLLRAREDAAPLARVSQAASLPDEPVSPKPWNKALVAAGVGALLAMLFHQLSARHARPASDDRVGSSADLRV